MNAIITVLTSPRLTFEKIRDNGGAFAIPFIFLLVVSLVAIILQIPAIEAGIAAVDLPEGVDPEQMKQIGVISGIVFGTITIAASVFITGLLLMLVNLIVRGDAKYMQLVKVGVLSSMPGLINALLLGILAQTMEPQSVNSINLSLGAFIENKSGLLYSLASMLNPFSLWGLAIMVIGTAVMSNRTTKSVSIWIIGGWIVINGLLAAIGASFS